VEWPSGEATACKAVHTGSIPVSTSRFVSPARLAQRESASLTRKRSLVQSQYRAPQFVQLKAGFSGQGQISATGTPGASWRRNRRIRAVSSPVVEDTWASRDLPVLKAIVQIYEDTGRTLIPVTDIQQAVGFDKDTMRRAIQAVSGFGRPPR
jgi:hypothetical protein